MLAALIGNTLLREVPGHLVAGVRTGDLKVYGSIIRSLSNGRIVGHLQETSGLTNVAGRLISASSGLPLPGLGTAIDFAGHAVSFVQNEQIKAAVGIVQELQLANLALGVASIGVSVAGFAILSAKIGRVEAKIDALGDRLDRISRGIDALRRDRIAEDFTRLRTAIEQMEEGWGLADPAPQWRQVATEAHTLANLFERRASDVLGLDHPALAEAEPFLEALALAAATRVSARLAAGDDLVARRAAQEGAKTLFELGNRVDMSRDALSQVENEKPVFGTVEWGMTLDRCADGLRKTMANVRHREAAAAATVLTLAELEEQQIGGRSWLETARAENDAPLLFLPAKDA